MINIQKFQLRLIIRVVIKSLPDTLIVQFKRFKYDEKLNRLIKLNWKIAFSFNIRIDSVFHQFD